MAVQTLILENESNLIEKLKSNEDDICPQPSEYYPLAYQTNIERQIFKNMKKYFKKRLKNVGATDLNNLLNDFINTYYQAKFENNEDAKAKFMQEIKVELQSRCWGKSSQAQNFSSLSLSQEVTRLYI